MEMEDNPIWSIYLVSYFRSFEAKNRHLFDVHIRQQLKASLRMPAANGTIDSHYCYRLKSAQVFLDRYVEALSFGALESIISSTFLGEIGI